LAANTQKHQVKNLVTEFSVPRQKTNIFIHIQTCEYINKSASYSNLLGNNSHCNFNSSSNSKSNTTAATANAKWKFMCMATDRDYYACLVHRM